VPMAALVIESGNAADGELSREWRRKRAIEAPATFERWSINGHAGQTREGAAYQGGKHDARRGDLAQSDLDCDAGLFELRKRTSWSGCEVAD